MPDRKNTRFVRFIVGNDYLAVDVVLGEPASG